MAFDIRPNPVAPANPIIPKLVAPGSNRVLKWLTLAALVLFVVTILLFWFGGTSFRDKDVVAALEGPSQAKSGDEAVYKLSYTNATNTTLHNLSFRFFYPDGSVVIRPGVFSEELSEGFEIETLKAGEKGEREFHAFLIGDKGAIKVAKLDLIFQAGSLRSSFEKSQTVSTTIIGLPVPLTLSVPPTAVSGQPVAYTLDYRNESDTDIADARFEFAYPEGFILSRTAPQPSESNNVWTVPLIKKGVGARITITGTLTGGERDEKTVSVTLKRKIQDQYLDYERVSAATVISSPLLGLTMAVNGARDYAASVGDSLRYSIQYRNSSNANLLGLTLAVKLEGEMYDIASLQTNGGFFDGSSGTILWNAGSVPNLANLAPGGSGTVDFGIRLKQAFPSGALGSKTFFVKATAVLSTPNVPAGLDGDQVSAQDSVTTKISTQPTLAVLMYVNDPAFGASGPIPPQVGKETLFTVHWQVANPGNDIGNAVVKAVLPSGISWKNVVSAGAGQAVPTYDRNRSEVSWNIGTIPHGIGVISAKYEGSFQIGITPSLNQKGTTPIIIRSASFSGKDSFTGQNILITSPDMTTANTVDRPNDGVVQ